MSLNTYERQLGVRVRLMFGQVAFRLFLDRGENVLRHQNTHRVYRQSRRGHSPRIPSTGVDGFYPLFWGQVRPHQRSKISGSAAELEYRLKDVVMRLACIVHTGSVYRGTLQISARS